MSVLPEEALTSLNALLENLISSVNEIRSQAEKSLNENWISGGEERRSLLLVGLAEQSCMAQNSTVSIPRYCFKNSLHTVSNL